MSMRYKNPIWPGYFADPFVLPWEGGYYAYGTGEALVATGSGTPRAFPVLYSRDLVTWSSVGGALEVPAGAEARAFWAPEVAAHDGRFYLYYSSAPSGRDELHRLRVAVASDPAGPFVDAGVVLPESEGFCVDAHPFRDPRDGQWYLFFARDFFEDRTGTGLAVAPLASNMLRPSGPARAVLRANADWQIYERHRRLYGRTWDAWHTVEGPCVVEHDGRYYCFYSGGNWQTQEYGVSYAWAAEPLGPWQHTTERGPVVLRQVSGRALGPGHNSHVLAPDGRTALLVYHAWDAKKIARRMCLDPLVWTKDGPRCRGPSTTEQEIPGPR